MSDIINGGIKRIKGHNQIQLELEQAEQDILDITIAGINLTGPITSVGNATSIASQTGTGTKFVVDTSPTLITPNIGVATATSVNGTTIPASKTLVVTTDKLSTLAATTSAELAGVISDETGSGALVFANMPTLITPNIGNATGNITGQAGTVITNANLTGPITSAGNVTSVAAQTGTGSTFVMNTSPTLVTPVLGAATATTINSTSIPTSKTLVVTTDKLSVLAATTSAELAGVISDETGSGALVFANSPVLITPNIGSANGSISGNAATVTTNANLTGPITSVGNATSVASQTGTGSTFVMSQSPSLVTPALGTPSALVGTNISGTALNLTAGAVAATPISKGQNTGLISGGVVTINADPTKFDVSAGTGIVVDWSVPTAPVATSVSWGAFTAQTIPDFTKAFTSVEIDSAGALVKVSSNASDGTPAVRRVKIVLNLLQHFGGTQVERVLNIVQLGYDVTASHHDYIYQLGPINKGNNASANGANLQINKASGTTTLPYINYPTDLTNPSIRTNSSASAVTFNYNYRNGSGGFVITADTANINPDQYDTGTGTLVTVANNKYTIQRIYYFAQSDKYGIVYGQAEYANLTVAQAAINSENPIINPLSESGSFVTALIVKKSTTALNNTADALFAAISNALSSPVATTTLQGAYSNSTTPEITTDATRGALSIKRGSAADTDMVLEVLNNAGTTVAAVQGNGWTGVGTGTPAGSLDVFATTFNPGTVAVTGSAITGTSTSFTKTFKQGDSITTTTTSGSETKEIQTIVSDTSMTTVAAFAGTNSGASYTSSNSGSQFVVYPSGSIRIYGTTGVSASNTSDWIYKADTVTTTGTQAFSTIRDKTTYNNTTAAQGAINTFQASTTVNGTGTGSFTNVRGFSAAPTIGASNTGNVTALVGYLSQQNITAGATGTVTGVHGILINGTNSSTTNTVTNQYGVNVQPVQAGGTLTSYAGVAVNAKPAAATNSSLLLLGTTTIPSGNFGIYNSSTNANYLAGELGIGTVPSSSTQLLLTASTTAKSSVRIAHGAAPTSPVDGDMWTTTAGLFIRINGVTKTVTLT
jgi:hypothetical protein